MKAIPLLSRPSEDPRTPSSNARMKMPVEVYALASGSLPLRSGRTIGGSR